MTYYILNLNLESTVESRIGTWVESFEKMTCILVYSTKGTTDKPFFILADTDNHW